MKILFTFPGQGAQRPGMLAEIPNREAILAQARTVLGEDIDNLDSTESLQHTRAVQLCLLIAGVAWARELQSNGINPQMVCGLSIGAFPAAVIAGVLDFASALRLVALRGDLMEQAYPKGYGLTAIMGLTRPRLETLMKGHDVYLANLNTETQIVIAGRDEAMAEVAQLALQAGAIKAQRLAVNVPSHCTLLDKPAATLAQAFADIPLGPPQCAYLSGSTARVLMAPQLIADDLAKNMARPVHWQEAMVAADERDLRLAIEMPPGGVLTCLTRQAGWRGDSISLERSGLDVAHYLAQRLNE